MAIDPEPLGEDLTNEASQPSEMVNVDIAPEGDVIFVLQQTRLRVSSVILASASPVFKVMFGPNFAEGQGNRTAGEPREVPLHDDDLCAMTRLCRLLHHQPDKEAFPHGATRDQIVQYAQEFYTLTGLVDKYGCADSLRMVGGYLLAQFGASSVSHGLPLEGVLALVAASFTIRDSRYFALFTRYLVLNTSVSYSTLVKHHVVASLPSSFFLLVEEQRRSALTLLTLELLELGCSYCSRCQLNTQPTSLHTYSEASNFMRKQLNLHTDGPPVRCKSLRKILKGACKSDNVKLHSCQAGAHEIVVTGTSLKDVCNKVSNVACGLCLICLEDGGDEASCTHRDLLQRWTKDDPIT